MRAYREFGVRSFAFDSDEELDKIVAETGGAKDLDALPPRGLSQYAQPHPARGQVRRLERGGAGAPLTRAPDRASGSVSLSMSGSQAVVPAAFGEAIRQIGQLIVTSGVMVDAIDIGGGFPSRYPHSDPPELATLHGRGGARGRRACGQAFLRASVRAGPGARGRGRVGDRSRRCPPRRCALCQ